MNWIIKLRMRLNCIPLLLVVLFGISFVSGWAQFESTSFATTAISGDIESINSPTKTLPIEASTPDIDSPISKAPEHHVHKLENVKNLRDIATASTQEKLKSGRIFRTGCVSKANDKDVTHLHDHLNIKTFIDIRSEQEWADDHALHSPVYEGFHSFEYHRNNAVFRAKALSFASSDIGARDSKYRYFVSLVNEMIVAKTLFPRLSIVEKFKVLALAPISKLSKTAYQMMRDVFSMRLNAGGLELLNELIIDAAGKEMVEVIKLIADANHYPVAVYCTAGKDRTGLISLFILSILELSDEEIIADYSISDSVYRDLNDHTAMVASLQQTDIKPDVFLAAKPETIQHAMTYIRRKYGSIEKYLERFGFDESWRNKLRDHLLHPILKPTDQT